MDRADAQPPRARGDRRARRSATSPSRRSTAWRSRSSTATACSSAARRAATARSARTSPTTCARSRRSRCASSDAPPLARGARRGLHVAQRLRRAQRAPRRAGPVDVHEPAQRRRRDDPPARPQARRASGRCRCGATASGRPRGSPSARTGTALTWLRERGFRVNERRRPARRRGGGRRAAAWPGRSAAARSTSRSTASSSRSTTSSCSGAWASSGAIRAGRSPGSSRRRRR